MKIENVLILTKTVGELKNKHPILCGKDDTIYLNVETVYNLSEATITLQNGGIKRTYRFTPPFAIPEELRFSGWLGITIDMFIDGTRAKQWKLLPMKIIENDGEILPKTEILGLDGRLSAVERNKATNADLAVLREQINELVEKHNKLADIVGLLKE